MELNIIIAGVGGQGTLLASKILGNYALLKGYDCKLSEVHGMAQRGGSVVTYVRFGEKVYSPTVTDGEADVLLAFEELEALRYAHNVKKGGKLIFNTQKIMPLPVIIGAAEYPGSAAETLKSSGIDVYCIDALSAAGECGSQKAVNTVMIGYLGALAGLDFISLNKALSLSVPEKHLQINKDALKKGYEFKNPSC